MSVPSSAEESVAPSDSLQGPLFPSSKFILLNIRVLFGFYYKIKSTIEKNQNIDKKKIEKEKQ